LPDRAPRLLPVPGGLEPAGVATRSPRTAFRADDGEPDRGTGGTLRPGESERFRARELRRRVHVHFHFDTVPPSLPAATADARPYRCAGVVRSSRLTSSVVRWPWRSAQQRRVDDNGEVA